MNRNNNKYLVELTETNGQFKVNFAKKLTPLNQYRNTWRRVNARDLSRRINVGEMVIK